MDRWYRIARMLPEPIKIFLRPIPRVTYRSQRLIANIGPGIKYWRLCRRFPLPKEVEEQIVQVLEEIPEGRYCPLSKTRVMASLIIEHKLKRTVEIGVYRGSSLFPQAVAQRYIGGIAVGIDPYSADEAKQFNNREILDPREDIIKSRDWESVYQSVLDTIELHDFSNYCEIMRMTSDQAANLIEPGVDMVHIDGNHDYVKVESDIKNYVPKLRVGGFLVMDDISWRTIAPQYESLKKRMKLLHEVCNSSEAWGCLIKV